MGKTAKRSKMGVYSSLVTDRAQKLLSSAKRKNSGEKKPKKSKPNPNLKPLPREQPARFFAHFRWERIKAYWFSKDGLKRIGKIFAACILLGVIAVGALFVYYKSQLKEIQLSNLTISETVNTYLDRNGVVLWEDKGDSDYRLVVDGDDISTYVRQATVAIEDKSFYNHPGVDFSALVRAALSTISGHGVQGGSTLTQQLIKQLYFSDEAASANRGGIARKVKELILSIELEKMYSKEQIITMYLNESPYGGRRNGIESAAQTYFGKSAKDLNLAESALLAAIPNNPAVLNPYNEYGNEDLIARQHKVLDDMVGMGYITEDEAREAKEVAILDQILPESSQYDDIKAPHFVMEVKKQLEEKYGMQTMRTGGYVIKTTLDYRAQQMAEEAVALGAKSLQTNGSDNIALASVDTDSGQVIAMVGSVDWKKPVYGEVNAAVSQLEPGSTIKPVLDYSPLFSLTGDKVYGPGTILKDENIDSIYCAGYRGACALRNFTGRFYGNITIRESLGNSLNIGAVKALSIVGIDNALNIAHALGDISYCANGGAAGLSMAIGSGCTVTAVEHANTYASFARGGVYKELAYVLELKDSSGKVLESWQDTSGERAIDEQVAYEIANILSDSSARKLVFGSSGTAPGFVISGVWTGTKTGTSTTSNSAVAKDLWMASFSTAVSTVVWNGNHDGSGLRSSSNNVTRIVVNSYMSNVHHNLYAQEGKWKSGDEPKKPAGIQTLTVNGKTDIWPSWYNDKKSGIVKETVAFNKRNGLRAADCTPESQRVEIELTKTVDPVSGTEIWNIPDGYKYDEVDTCDVVRAEINISRKTTETTDELIIKFTEGSSPLVSYRIYSGSKEVAGGKFTKTILSNGLSYPVGKDEKSVTIEVTDEDGEVVKKTFSNLGNSSGTGGSTGGTGDTSGGTTGTRTSNTGTVQ